ncbi:hypothetical protein [Arthrobacter sp. TPD3018]|uniref:hypothetical protein n=1 Tax=Arthrobacter sp. TPD3018 TaxID=2171974 RepID=UPI00256FB284|nr:hypothetical protein [Arthrobacter sp. TPD3018]
MNATLDTPQATSTRIALRPLLTPGDAGGAIGYIGGETEGAMTMNDRKIRATRPALSVCRGLYVELSHPFQSLRRHA